MLRSSNLVNRGLHGMEAYRFRLNIHNSVKKPCLMLHNVPVHIDLVPSFA